MWQSQSLSNTKVSAVEQMLLKNWCTIVTFIRKSSAENKKYKHYHPKTDTLLAALKNQNNFLKKYSIYLITIAYRTMCYRNNDA